MVDPLVDSIGYKDPNTISHVIFASRTSTVFNHGLERQLQTHIKPFSNRSQNSRGIDLSCLHNSRFPPSRDSLTSIRGAGVHLCFHLPTGHASSSRFNELFCINPISLNRYATRPSVQTQVFPLAAKQHSSADGRAHPNGGGGLQGVQCVLSLCRHRCTDVDKTLQTPQRRSRCQPRQLDNVALRAARDCVKLETPQRPPNVNEGHVGNMKK